MLPLANNPIEREWFMVHLASRQLPQVALAFAQFLREKGQSEILRYVAEQWGADEAAA
jgi:hypothetical protein